MHNGYCAKWSCESTSSNAGSCSGIYEHVEGGKVWINGDLFQWENGAIYDINKNKISGASRLKCFPFMNGKEYYNISETQPTNQFTLTDQGYQYLEQYRSDLLELYVNNTHFFDQNPEATQSLPPGSFEVRHIPGGAEWYKAKCNGNSREKASDAPTCQTIRCGDASSLNDEISAEEGYRCESGLNQFGNYQCYQETRFVIAKHCIPLSESICNSKIGCTRTPPSSSSSSSLKCYRQGTTAPVADSECATLTQPQC